MRAEEHAHLIALQEMFALMQQEHAASLTARLENAQMAAE
jgi:hypothetical protein